jgi:hypothetical protein
VRKSKWKNWYFKVLGFHCVAKNIDGWLKICTLFLVCSQMWLHLPRDNRHFFYIFLLSYQ